MITTNNFLLLFEIRDTISDSHLAPHLSKFCVSTNYVSTKAGCLFFIIHDLLRRLWLYSNQKAMLNNKYFAKETHFLYFSVNNKGNLFLDFYDTEIHVFLKVKSLLLIQTFGCFLPDCFYEASLDSSACKA